MELFERKLREEEIFSGRIIHVHVDTVELPNGHTSTREVVNHPGGVGIMALDEEDRVLTVTQYRYPYGKTLLEIPAGKLERGEDPYAAALRELREETGARAEKLTPLGEIYPTPGYCDEIIRIYFARDLSWGDTDPDDDEFLQVQRIPLEKLAEEALAGRLQDAKTVIAVMKAKLLHLTGR